MCGRPTHRQPTHSLGYPSPRPRRNWCFCNLHGILGVVAIPHPMGSLEAFRRSRARRSRGNLCKSRGKCRIWTCNGAKHAVSMLHCDYWAGITALPDWDGHHAAAPCTHRCNQWHRDARSTGSSNDPPKCRPTAGCYSPSASHALLLQKTDIPAETARLVRCHNPWPSEDVYFCPEDALPAFVTGVPAL